MYDTMIIRCASCGEETNSQTKILGGNMMSHFEIGDKIEVDEFANCIFGLKDKCRKCKKEINIIIKDKRIIGTTKDKPHFREWYFGNYEIVDELKNMVSKKTGELK